MTFVIFWRDKRAAVAGRRRVPDITLWVLSVAGGVWGGWSVGRLVFLGGILAGVGGNWKPSPVIAIAFRKVK